MVLTKEEYEIVIEKLKADKKKLDDRTVYVINIPGKPISINHYYGMRGVKRGFVSKWVTPEGMAYQKLINSCPIIAEKESSPRFKMTDKLIALEITYMFNDNRKRDIDNYFKPILDAMKGKVYIDDSQVFELIVHKKYNNQAIDSYTEVRIWELNDQECYYGTLKHGAKKQNTISTPDL